MDRISTLRARIAKHIDLESRVATEFEESLSPSGRHRMTFDVYRTRDTDLNWSVAQIEVSDVGTSEVLHRYIRGDDRCFYGWAATDEDEFLLLSEDLEGQSIFSCGRRQFVSVAPDDDPFIWCAFHQSPSGRLLAVEGCYWACPYMVIVYDFADPLSLPLPKVYECVQGDNTSFDRWLSDDTFQLKGVGDAHPIHTIT